MPSNLLNRFGVSRRLLLISVAFTLPLSVTTYLVVSTINANIAFSQMELYGDQYQAPLEAVLEGVAVHRQATFAVASGDQSQEPTLDDSAKRIDAAFEALADAQAQVGEALQFTPEGLAQRKREHVAVDGPEGMDRPQGRVADDVDLRGTPHPSHRRPPYDDRPRRRHVEPDFSTRISTATTRWT